MLIWHSEVKNIGETTGNCTLHWEEADMDKNEDGKIETIVK
jgi:hypothetical protein